MRNCFQHPLEGHSETSNDQALLNPFDHYIKMKPYMRVEGGGDTLTRGRLYPPPPHPIDYVNRDEICEIVCSILLRGLRNFK